MHMHITESNRYITSQLIKFISYSFRCLQCMGLPELSELTRVRKILPLQQEKFQFILRLHQF